MPPSCLMHSALHRGVSTKEECPLKNLGRRSGLEVPSVDLELKSEQARTTTQKEDEETWEDWDRAGGRAT